MVISLADAGTLTFCPILHQRFLHLFSAPASCCSSSSSSQSFDLPPGEEGSSALETLCVGLTVGSLRCSGCFDDHWGHLDQLQRGFSILQGLAQVEDLGRIEEKV